MTGEENEEKKEKTEIEKLTKERDEYLEGWRRAEANLINYKKEELKHLEGVAKFGNEDLLRDLLTVLDSLEIGIAVLEKAGSVDKGIYLIKNQLENVLKVRGLEKIRAKVGEKFNPLYHEVVGEMEGGEAETIAEEVATGYRLHDKVLRPVRVKIFTQK